MAADAPQGVAASVQVKSLLRIDPEYPAAEAGAGFIPAFQLSCRRIQIGIVHTIPQVDIFNDKFRLSVAVFRGYGFAFAMHGHGDSCRILPGFHGYGSAVFFQIHNGRHLDAGCAVPEQFKMLSRHRDQPDFPVQTAVEGEVCLLRIHAIIVLVADGDLQQVPFSSRNTASPAVSCTDSSRAYQQVPR